MQKGTWVSHTCKRWRRRNQKGLQRQCQMPKGRISRRCSIHAHKSYGESSYATCETAFERRTVQIWNCMHQFRPWRDKVGGKIALTYSGLPPLLLREASLLFAASSGSCSLFQFWIRFYNRMRRRWIEEICSIAAMVSMRSACSVQSTSTVHFSTNIM